MRCHRVTDHSKVDCTTLVESTCTRQHKSRVRCGKQDGCYECAREDRETERRLRRDFDLEKKRVESQKAYQQELEQIQDELAHHNRQIKYMREDDDNKRKLAEQRAAAETLKQTSQSMRKQKEDALTKKNSANAIAGADLNPPMLPPPDAQSNAKEEWEYLKSEGAQNEFLDELVSMIGLEEVKQELLNVKLKVDTTIRQETSLATERFSCSLLGNPGTGKSFTCCRFLGSSNTLLLALVRRQRWHFLI